MKQGAIIVLVAATAVAGGVFAGCQRGNSSSTIETPTKVQRIREPDRQVFAPFAGLIDASQLPLPFLLDDDEDVVDSPCFQLIEDVIAVEATDELNEPIKQHKTALSRLLREWVRNEVNPTAVNDSLIDTWTIVPVKVASIEIDDTTVRFVEDEECIDNSTGWMERDVRVVAGLYGARTFEFTAKTPITRASAEELLQEFEAMGFIVATEDLVDLEEVLDDDGEPRRGDEGEKLYRHPDLGVVSEHDVTPPERQRMKNWTAEAPSAVYFGYRELSKVAWRRESNRDKCNVNLVWQDPAYREPECDEFSAAGFKAARKGDRLEIQMRSGEEEKTLEMDYGDVERMRVSDRVVLWISPVAIEEGVLIRVNSLVLSP